MLETAQQRCGLSQPVGFQGLKTVNQCASIETNMFWPSTETDLTNSIRLLLARVLHLTQEVLQAETESGSRNKSYLDRLRWEENATSLTATRVNKCSPLLSIASNTKSTRSTSNTSSTNCSTTNSYEYAMNLLSPQRLQGVFHKS